MGLHEDGEQEFARDMLNEELRRVADQHFAELFETNPAAYRLASERGLAVAQEIVIDNFDGQPENPAISTFSQAVTKLIFLFQQPEDEYFDHSVTRFASRHYASTGNLQTSANMADTEANDILAMFEVVQQNAGIAWEFMGSVEKLWFAAGVVSVHRRRTSAK